MTSRRAQIRTRDPNLMAPLFCWGISAGLVCMDALLTVGGTMDTLAAGEPTTASLWGCVGAELGGVCGWSLCLGPLVVVVLVEEGR